MIDVASQKGFKLIHLNIRSLINKYEQLKLELANISVDIFSISETRLAAGVSTDIIQIPGYNIIRYDRNHIDYDTGLPKRGGGLAIYYADTLCCDSIKWAHLNVSCPDIEVQIVEFVRYKARNIIFVNIYRPPNGNVQKMVDGLTNIITVIPRIYRKDIVFMGDFNIDIVSKTPDSNKLIRFSELNNLVQKINMPTRITPTTSSTIDLIFCNMTHVSSCGVLNLFLSDHQPIFLIKKMNTKSGKNGPNNNIKFPGRTYRQYTPAAMQEMVDMIDMNRVILSDDPTVCWTHLHHTLSSIANKLITEKENIVKNELPAWLTPELINLKKR